MGPTHLKINHPNLVNNYNVIKNTIGSRVKVMGMIKANAYGHGIVEIAKTLEKEHIAYFGVAFPEEGITLRKAGIKTPILVVGAHLTEYLKQHVENKLDITITHIDQLTYLNTYCLEKNTPARIHLKIDTGMNRVGFKESDFYKAYEFALKCPAIEVVGIYSHLSSSDEDDQSYTQKQVELFKKVKQSIRDKSNHVLFHIANSAGIIQNPDYWFDMVRPGILLFGNPPSSGFNINNEFKEVMSFHSRVTLIKDVGKNEPVSYNRRYYAKEKTKIALIPVGYADGYNRQLTNNGFVLINGKRHPVIGSVCMDQILVDLGYDSNIKIGAEVVLFGKQQDEHIPIAEIAKRVNTIPYEITCWISSRVERIHQN